MLDDTNTGRPSLNKHAKGAEHRKASVLDLLRLLLEVFLLSVLESERVETGLTKSKVTGVLVAFNNSLDTVQFNSKDDQRDLPQTSRGHRVEGLERVGLSESILWDANGWVAFPVEERRNDESDDGKHRDTGMDDLGLTIPLEVATQEGRWVVRESSGVEASVTRESSIKGGRSLVEGEGRGSVAGLARGDT